ncbi:unnamed protein product, partial [Rotaria socialis]
MRELASSLGNIQKGDGHPFQYYDDVTFVWIITASMKDIERNVHGGRKRIFSQLFPPIFYRLTNNVLRLSMFNV